jgi:uncharacterized protein YdeI (YjbR/CyaY-like superfamily)
VRSPRSRPRVRREILRYLNHAKTEATRTRNIDKAVRFLLGDDSAGLAAFRQRAPRVRKA